MGSKLYVGGLPYSVTEGSLRELFSAHGTVESANVISDKFTGQSRGFGFVEMSSSGEAQSAIQSLNGTQFEGRSLTSMKPNRWRSAITSAGSRNGDRDGGRNRY
jgi:RNA recognition motif-containing protein